MGKWVMAFVAGSIFSVVVGVVLLRNKVTPLMLTAPKPTLSIPDSRKVKIKVDFSATPKPVKDTFAGKTGDLELVIFSARQGGVEESVRAIITGLDGSLTERELEFEFPTTPDLSGPLWKPEGAILRGRFCTRENNCNIGPYIAFRVPLPVEPSRIKNGATLDFGKLAFNRNFPSGSVLASCKPGASILSGKIEPTTEFVKNFPPGKKLVMYLTLYNSPASIPGAGEFLSKYVAAYQDVVYSPSGIEYSFPRPANLFADYYFAGVALCDSAQDSLTCLKELDKFDVNHVPTDPAHNYFNLVPKDLRFPACGDQNVTWYLHWFPPTTKNSVPTLAHERDQNLPPEIVEGTYQ